jgi:hypothetical protein
LSSRPLNSNDGYAKAISAKNEPFFRFFMMSLGNVRLLWARLTDRRKKSPNSCLYHISSRTECLFWLYLWLLWISIKMSLLKLCGRRKIHIFNISYFALFSQLISHIFPPRVFIAPSRINRLATLEAKWKASRRKSLFKECAKKEKK